jgi:hypothetical protein
VYGEICRPTLHELDPGRSPLMPSHVYSTCSLATLEPLSQGTDMRKTATMSAPRIALLGKLERTASRDSLAAAAVWNKKVGARQF